MARAGFDWITLDMEHSGLLDQLRPRKSYRVFDLCGVPPLVRVMDNRPEMIKRYHGHGGAWRYRTFR